MAITILKNNVPWGPFTRPQIQEGLTRGDFTLQYLAHVPGLREWLPLGEVLDYFDHRTGLPPVPASMEALPSVPVAPHPASSLSQNPSPLIGAPRPPSLPTGPEFKPTPPPLVPPVQTSGPKFMPVPPVRTELKPARFFPRFIAFVIDCAVLFVPVVFLFGLGALTITIQGLWEHADAETMHQEWELLWRNFRELLGLVALGGAWLYAASLECSRWQATVGKQWIGMKVVDRQGERMSFFRATGRHAAKFISALPLFLGFTMALFSSNCLALHDRLAGTRVVKKV